MKLKLRNIVRTVPAPCSEGCIMSTREGCIMSAREGCTISARAYSFLLSLYPADLRRDFGEEMTQVFLEDLEDSRHVNGFRGVARVWWRALKELVRIAMPPEASKREIAVPIVMYVLQELYLGAVILLSPFDPAMPIWPKTAGQRLVLIFFPGVIPAIIASVALRIGNRSVPEPLNLGCK